MEPLLRPQTIDNVMTWAMFTMATFGLLRLSEFTVRRTRINTNSNTISVPSSALRWRDITWYDREGRRIHYFEGRLSKHPAEYRITLQASKTDPFRKGVIIRVFAPTAVKAMKAYANLLGGTANYNAPLFTNTRTGHPISRQEVLAKLDELVAGIGLDPHHYNGHSFRKGGAQALHEAGVESDMIKAIGRWSSDCYKLYINQNTETLRTAALAIDPANETYQSVQ